MDKLNSEVGQINSTLQSSRRTLQVLEYQAQESIGEKVAGMKGALVNSDRRLEYVSSDIKCFLRTIEYHNPSSVDLSPQMNWLSTNLTKIVRELQTAESHADAALDYATTYHYQVKDVGQTVDINKNQLDNQQREGERLASLAQSQLSASEQLMEQAQAQICAKKREISCKTSQASSLRSRKQTLESNIAEKRRAIAQAESKATRKKEKGAAFGIGAGILGIVLAPVTGGASLVLTAAGAGVGVGTAVDVSELRDKASTLRSSANRLQAEIDESTNQITKLVKEKTELQSLVLQYQSQVKERQINHKRFQAQIQKARKAQTDIEALKSSATSTTINVKELERELQATKERLDQCSALLNLQSFELQTSSTFADRFLGEQRQRAKTFKRQKKVNENIIVVLDRMHVELPALLPSEETRFIDFKSMDVGNTSCFDLGDSLPDVHLRP